MLITFLIIAYILLGVFTDEIISPNTDNPINLLIIFVWPLIWFSILISIIYLVVKYKFFKK